MPKFRAYTPGKPRAPLPADTIVLRLVDVGHGDVRVVVVDHLGHQRPASFILDFQGYYGSIQMHAGVNPHLGFTLEEGTHRVEVRN